MDKNRSIKETVGKVVGDAKLQVDGKADRAEGKIQNVVGAIKDSQAVEWFRRLVASNSSARLVAHAAVAEQPVVHNFPSIAGPSEPQEHRVVRLQVTIESKRVIPSGFSRDAVRVAPAYPFLHHAEP